MKVDGKNIKKKNYILDICMQNITNRIIITNYCKHSKQLK